MKTKSENLRAHQKRGRSDDFQTPAYALGPLLPYIPKDWVVWECACGNGNLVTEFRKQGYRVIWSDIKRDRTEDFLTCRPRRAQVIITNPPYSLKDEFIGRCYEIGRPFALLLPTSDLGGIKRGTMYRMNGLQIIVPDARIEFETPSGKPSNPWFHTSWFTYGLGLPKDMMFVELEKK